MCNVTLFSCRKQKCQEYKSQKMRFLQMEQMIVSYKNKKTHLSFGFTLFPLKPFFILLI